VTKIVFTSVIAHVISHGAGYHNERNNIKGKRGIYWKFSERLEDVDFADDLCLLSQNF
jgi:hypothetical protein